MPLEVVVVTCSNAGLLDAVCDGVFDHAVQPAYLDAFLADARNLLLVAVDGGAVIGMASGILYTHPDKPLQLFANEIGVAPSHRRRGIGRRLLEALLQAAAARGCREAWLATEENNAAARALYVAAAGREDPDRAVVYTWTLATEAAAG